MRFFKNWKFGRGIPEAPEDPVDRQFESDNGFTYGPAPAHGRPDSILMDRRGRSNTPFQDILREAMRPEVFERNKGRPLPGDPDDTFMQDWKEPGSEDKGMGE